MSESPTLSPGSEPVPVTGHPEIDAAIESLAGLDQLAPSEHHDRLVRVHEVLDTSLHPDRGA
jgi:hypothetical protein